MRRGPRPDPESRRRLSGGMPAPNPVRTCQKKTRPTAERRGPAGIRKVLTLAEPAARRIGGHLSGLSGVQWGEAAQLPESVGAEIRAGGGPRLRLLVGGSLAHRHLLGWHPWGRLPAGFGGTPFRSPEVRRTT